MATVDTKKQTFIQIFHLQSQAHYRKCIILNFTKKERQDNKPKDYIRSNCHNTGTFAYQSRVQHEWRESFSSMNALRLQNKTENNQTHF